MTTERKRKRAVDRTKTNGHKVKEKARGNETRQLKSSESGDKTND